MDELVKVEAHDAEVLCLEYSKPETGEPMAREQPAWQSHREESLVSGGTVNDRARLDLFTLVPSAPNRAQAKEVKVE